jgi:hypothetical protein
MRAEVAGKRRKFEQQRFSTVVHHHGTKLPRELDEDGVTQAVRLTPDKLIM